MYVCIECETRRHTGKKYSSASDSLKWKTNKIFNQTEEGAGGKCVRKIAKYFYFLEVSGLNRK